MESRSYEMGTFRDNEEALARLKRQASILVQQELMVLRRAGLKDGARIMDVGAGPATTSIAIAKAFAPKRLAVIDNNEQLVEEAKRNLAAAGIPAEVHRADVQESSWTLGEFDFIYARMLFQHLPDPLLAVRNLARHLAPAGRLCICDIDDRWASISPTVPEFHAFLERTRLAQRRRGGNRQIGAELPSTLRQAGLSDIASEVQLISTDLITKDMFTDLVFGYKMEVVPDQELRAALNEVALAKAAIGKPAGWGGVGVFFVSGAKQGQGLRT